MTLAGALAIRGGEVISLVGGGGKTTLLFALGRELSSRRKGVILTTTTKIWEPVPSADFALFLSGQISEIKTWIAQSLETYPCLLIAAGRLASGKLQGIAPSWAEEIISLPAVSAILVEADGAAGRSLKAPREGEPVLPPNTTLLVPVVGIDVLGRLLEEENVFRSEIAARILKKPKGSPVTCEMIAALLRELIKGKPSTARVIPFLNKMDLPGGLEKGRRLAQILLSPGEAKIEKVILGQARESPGAKEIVFPSGAERLEGQPPS
jgi:probable selenium-dependent hydroxylase accessory protein YqeC